MPEKAAQIGIGCNADLSEIREEIQVALMGLSDYFKPHCTLTFVMRNPRCSDGHLLITSDRDLKALAAVLLLEAERQESDAR